MITRTSNKIELQKAFFPVEEMPISLNGEDRRDGSADPLMMAICENKLKFGFKIDLLILFA